MDDSPLYIAPFMGYKVLELGLSPLKVVSPYRNSFVWWPARTREDAHCRTNNSGGGFDHPSPYDECHCGYYAYYEFYDAMTNKQLFYRTNELAFEFVALVKAWGEVVLHESGFRSQYMEPIAIHDTRYPDKGKLLWYANNVGIPILDKNSLADIAREQGIVPDARMWI